jgi:hypothetical protein
MPGFAGFSSSQPTHVFNGITYNRTGAHIRPSSTSNEAP